MSAPIRSREFWAAVSPPARNGRGRWIAYNTVASTQRDARLLFTHPFRNATSGSQAWAHWRKRGWTIERVKLGPAN